MTSDEQMAHEVLLHEAIERMIRSEIGFDEAVRRFRDRYVGYAVAHCEGNKSWAANLLKIHRNTLVRVLSGKQKRGQM